MSKLSHLVEFHKISFEILRKIAEIVEILMDEKNTSCTHFVAIVFKALCILGKCSSDDLYP